MQNIEHLTELMERAASSINMLGPDDFSEIENLQKVLDEIKNSLGQMGECSSEVLNKASGETNSSIELLQKILRHEVEDTASSIVIVSKAIATLQGIIEQMGHAPVSPEPGKIQNAVENNIEDVSQAGVVISEDDIPLIIDFINESCEHIESAEAGLLELEDKPNDKDIINQIFRGFHTIKGMAGFLNLTDIGSLAHSAENLLGLVREDKMVLSGNVTDVVFESIDMMKKMINTLKECIEAGKPVPAQKNLPDFLAKLKRIAESEPEKQKENSSESAVQNPAEELNTVQDEKIENMLESPETSESNSASVKKESHAGDEKIKVSTTRLDNLINMVGELVIAQLMVSEEVSKKLSIEHQLNSKVASQSKIVRELQELSLSMRMVPIGGVFQKMARLARDLSRKSGKKINFSTTGDETELDRSIVDKISDPLIHMVRNSIDHGIEPEQDRIQSGKNPSGNLELRAFHQAGNIVIEIRDDGKGLDKERILQKAIEKKLVQPGQELSEDEIFKMIFLAGFSTAQKVTSISGRGVGMDVVRKNIELLNGKIEIQSIKGKGTIFTIRLPLTLAIIDGQIVKVGSERYIIPINSIINSLRPAPDQISTVQNRSEMVMVRGELMPLVRLYKLFRVVPVTENPTESLLVIVENNNKKYCLLVDELLDQQQVVIKNLGDGLGKVKGLSGGAIMGDGKVSLILDIPGIADIARF
ncbi:MAG: chemotaxis protein CheA [Sedimentisphaerales bacterium]|nr:chemotaxis protein CheA [Sedimentisphaerales bacterium]